MSGPIEEHKPDRVLPIMVTIFLIIMVGLGVRTFLKQREKATTFVTVQTPGPFVDYAAAPTPTPCMHDLQLVRVDASKNPISIYMYGSEQTAAPIVLRDKGDWVQLRPTDNGYVVIGGNVAASR